MTHLSVACSRWSVASALATLSIALTLLLALSVRPASAQNAYGTLSNFDVINDTGGECHGFEIELEGVRKEDVAWVFGAPWNRYGDPTREDKLDAQGNVIGAYLRYRSPVVPGTSSFLYTTRVPANLLPGGSGTITPTDGHACYAGGPVGDYDASGCEHFGLGFLSGDPTRTVYRWLVEDPYQPGQLITSDTKVSIPAVTWNVQPPVDPAINPNPIVRADLPAEPQEAWACSQFGEAQWVKVYKTEASHQVKLENLLTDDPEVPQDASETEIEWVLLQAAPTCDENGLALPADQQPENELALEAAIGDGNESVTRRYEFYKYTGVYGSYQDSHEAFPVTDTSPSDGELGDYIGAQMAAVNIIQPLAIASGALTVGEVGVPYTAPSLVSGGVQPYSVTVADGVIPIGLVLDPVTGDIAGTPTQAGNAGFILDVIDGSGSEAVSDAVTMNIASAVGVSTASLPAGTSGQSYSATLLASSGVGPYAWSKSAGTLPSGVTLKTDGTLSGTPTATGTFSPTFRVTDVLGATAQKSLTLTINAAAPAPLSVTTSSLAQGTKAKSYSATLAASGGTTPYTWALTSGTLPGGLSLGASTGTISGTPSATGTFSFIVKVTDKKSATATRSLSLTIAAASSGSGGSGSVDVMGSIGAINTNGKYFVVGGVNIYWSATTTFALNTNSGKVSSTGTPPAGAAVGMRIQGKGTKDTAGKITATALEIN